VADLMLVWDNATTFNHPEHFIHQVGVRSPALETKLLRNILFLGQRPLVPLLLLGPPYFSRREQLFVFVTDKTPCPLPMASFRRPPS
jgi:hypothetical protein